MPSFNASSSFFVLISGSTKRSNATPLPPSSDDEALSAFTRRRRESSLFLRLENRNRRLRALALLSFLLLPRFVQEDARSVDEEERDDDDGKEADIATRSSFRVGVGISIYVTI